MSSFSNSSYAFSGDNYVSFLNPIKDKVLSKSLLSISVSQFETSVTKRLTRSQYHVINLDLPHEKGFYKIVRTCSIRLWLSRLVYSTLYHIFVTKTNGPLNLSPVCKSWSGP